MNVSVIGAGKMGLPIAVQMASRGASVWACDVNPDVVRAIAAGDPNVDEPGVRELLRQVLATERLRATTDTAAWATGRTVLSSLNSRYPTHAIRRPPTSTRIRQTDRKSSYSSVARTSAWLHW